MTLEITQADIDTGVVGDNEHCPIALAASRVLGEPVAVSYLWLNYRGLPYDLPRAARGFLDKLLDGNPVRPFTFEIDLTKPWKSIL